jgi:Acetyltransferase (GNAT) domain
MVRDAAGPGTGRRRGPRAADTGYRVEVLRSVTELPPAVWARLTPPDDPMWARDLFAAMEAGNIGPDGYAYLAVVRDGTTEAVLPLCLYRGLRLDEVVGPRERRLLAPLRALSPRLLRVPMLFCGNLLGQGHVISREPLTPRVGRLLVGAAVDFARRHRLGTIVFKDFAGPELGPLRQALTDTRFFLVPSLPDTELPLGQPSFDDYIAGLPAKPRRNARSKIRKFQARTELRIEVLDDFAHLLPDMLGLYQQVMDRADQRLDVVDAAFLAAVQKSTELRPRLVACFSGDRLVAFLLCLFAGSGATGARIGLDYGIAHEARLYHNVHYAAIRLALDSGCRHIRFAQTAYQPKVELGCRLVEQSYAITHLRPVPRALLRRLLPPALGAALAQALGPHAPGPTAPPPDRSAARPRRRKVSRCPESK